MLNGPSNLLRVVMTLIGESHVPFHRQNFRPKKSPFADSAALFPCPSHLLSVPYPSWRSFAGVLGWPPLPPQHSCRLRNHPRSLSGREKGLCPSRPCLCSIPS